MAHEYQNSMVPCSGVQQFTPTPVQEFNVHMEKFVPVQYQATVPVVSQPVILGPMPSFSQASGPPRVPMLTNVRLARNGMAQSTVAAPVANQQFLN